MVSSVAERLSKADKTNPEQDKKKKNVLGRNTSTSHKSFAINKNTRLTPTSRVGVSHQWAGATVFCVVVYVDSPNKCESQNIRRPLYTVSTSRRTSTVLKLVVVLLIINTTVCCM